MKVDITPPVVGIGASAGGLEALEQFFTHIPTGCGAAFIVVQHLDPTHQGLLPELLQRVTPMKVTQADEGMKVQTNCIYVIPPNKDLSILQGKLQLLDPIAPRGLRLPIDFFFRALAGDQHERAIGVILSGMGSDSTLGLRAIKENAGLALAQLPDSAKFDAMPRSAIDAGLADIVATPETLWEKIASSLQQSRRGGHVISEPMQELKSQSALEQIVMLLRSLTGNDFSLYRKNTLYRRIERRMGLHQIDTIADYVRYLQENTQELELLFKELLIGVTHFFRDTVAWEQLKSHGIPALLAEYPKGKEMRAWVSACSTGEEAYSLAMVFKEVLAQCQLTHNFKLQIFATDLDADAIEKARQGFYPKTIAGDVSPERLSRFFVAEDNGYRINKDIREMVIFAQQNIIMDPPFTKLHLLLCRNLLIYLDPACQQKLIPLFHYALIPNGMLLLGNAETIGNFNDLFTAIDSRSRLYRRIDQALSFAEIEFPTKYFPVAAMIKSDNSTSQPVLNLQSQVEQLLLQKYSPSTVLINAEGDILYIHGRTGKYLEPAAGKANLNIHAMAREGLRHELAAAITLAQQQSEAVVVSGLTVGTNGGSQMINLTVQAIDKPEALKGALMIIFTDVAMPKPRKRSQRSPNAELLQVSDELQKAREENQSLREEAQSSQEELKSSNEELQSTNEELQSTNEELTTSKEEMQSLNEELQTVNAELQTKVNDLSWVNNDMKNLLNSMEIATIFLDNALNIRRFTNHATHLFKLIGGDVGRPLSDIVTDLDYPQLHQDALSVLRTLIFAEKQVKTDDDRWFKVRIMPYRTQENVIDGVVITFIDISETKKLEARVRGNNE
ncbi:MULTISPECIES: chemotaxis protein CheB [Methylomonas]|uniref:protein-glutamate O-methyltransferase n=2 Tax=Methylomonas TaxID=416 RepID=A0A126T4N4_9GAMM|nr:MULTISPECIES: chemotaxis protein CheB [Methylomonas]AMK77028.1 chemotaxis protein CheB [Methylomonas denitrificans]OAI04417.1 chemotaxis protein CheB [Methylomonas methanica]TCV81211.1 chemotaxis protein methyltransferase CheR/two-component system CheB/CheR fusion protein [Methylomonas methanica]